MSKIHLEIFLQKIYIDLEFHKSVTLTIGSRKTVETQILVKICNFYNKFSKLLEG